MKTSEFIKKVEDLGFGLSNNPYPGTFVFGDNDYGHWFVFVGRETVGHIEMNDNYLAGQEVGDYVKAIKLAVDYAFTPIKDREDE